MPGIEGALATSDQLYPKIEALDFRWRKIEVKDADTYAEMGLALNEAVALRKEWELVYSPFKLIAKRVTDFLRTKEQRGTNRIQEIEANIRAKLKSYEAIERERAEKDAEKTSKAVGHPVDVKAALPSIGGYRKTVTYKAELIDLKKFLAALRDAKGERRVYLMKFLTLDEKALNKEARDVKDPDELMKRIPGIRAWQD